MYLMTSLCTVWAGGLTFDSPGIMALLAGAHMGM